MLRKNGIHVACNVLYLRLLLAHFNTALTPLLYVIFIENYRRGFGEILSRLGCRGFIVSLSDSVVNAVRTSRRQSYALNNCGHLSIELKALGTSQNGSTSQLLA